MSLLRLTASAPKSQGKGGGTKVAALKHEHCAQQDVCLSCFYRNGLDLTNPYHLSTLLGAPVRTNVCLCGRGRWVGGEDRRQPQVQRQMRIRVTGPGNPGS